MFIILPVINKNSVNPSLPSCLDHQILLFFLRLDSPLVLSTDVLISLLLLGAPSLLLETETRTFAEIFGIFCFMKLATFRLIFCRYSHLGC